MTSVAHSQQQPAEVTQSVLAGKRVVVTRSAKQAADMVRQLRGLGAEPLAYPTIAYAPPDDLAALDAALTRLAAGEYDWLVLTSAQAVRVVAERCGDKEIGNRDQGTGDSKSYPERVEGLGHSALSTQPLRVAAVGAKTAAVCRDLLGVEADAVPERFIAEELAAMLGDVRGQRVLLPNADIAKPGLEQSLCDAGATVDRVVAYRTVPATDGEINMPALLAAGAIDIITFTSGSTVRYFVQGIGPAALAHARRTIVACIGPSTAQVAIEVGLPPTVVATVSTTEGLIDALQVELKARHEHD